MTTTPTLARDLKSGDVVTQAGQRLTVTQVLRFGLGSQVSVEFDGHTWKRLEAGKVVKVIRP